MDIVKATESVGDTYIVCVLMVVYCAFSPVLALLCVNVYSCWLL